MKICDRDYFMNFYKFINTDIDYNKENSESFSSIIPIQENELNYKNSLISNFLKDGFVLLEKKIWDYIEQVQDWLTPIFGEPITDSGISDKVYSKIVAEKDSKYFSNSNFTQPLHTDDAHTLNPPRIIVLCCEKQSSQGGVTTLIKFEDIYHNLRIPTPAIENLLYNDDVLEIDGVKGIFKKALFFALENERKGIAFPGILKTVKSSPEVIDIFTQIMDFIHKKNNQIRFKLKEGQILIIDNFRVLHGRTQFPMEDPRLLYRFCFNSLPT